MRYLYRIILIVLTVVVLTTTAAMAGKFPNKDTAKNRQNNVMSTSKDEGEEKAITIEKDKEKTTIKTKQPKRENRNWNEDIYITVEPEIKVAP